MRILDRLFGRNAVVAEPPEAAARGPCLHAALTARWNNVQEMGDESKATGWFCEACHEMFTPEEGRALRDSEGERLAAKLST